ncbi:MAG TPA: hypothetical protein VF599_16775 [Pyrinomonadaceae bacterium]|jgi:hypothetical protein
MSIDIDKELLYRRWVHSQEEDTQTEYVYRPLGYKLPRSRGRTGFELKSDRTAINLSIGPTDIPEETKGCWEIAEGETPMLQIRLDSGETQRLPISSVEKDRLVVRKDNT